MKKQTYQKPDVQVALLQHQDSLLVGSLNNTVTNLQDDDVIELVEDPTAVWGR